VAGVLKALWTLRYVPDVSMALKACVERHDPVYRGGSQHDAAEFLMFLLGKVHDDLNTASKRKYKRIKVRDHFKFFFVSKKIPILNFLFYSQFYYRKIEC